MAVLRPGDRPLRNLTLALLEREVLGEALGSTDVTQGSAAALIEAELKRGPLGLLHIVEEVRRQRPEGEGFNLLVLVDQFEEIFRYRGLGLSQTDEADALVNLLLASRGGTEERIFVGLTMRSDFLGNCVEFLDLPEAINHAQYLTPRLSRDELRAAITGPARLFAGDVKPDVVNELINAVSDKQDQLPILQHALARMWRLRSDAIGTHPSSPTTTWGPRAASPMPCPITPTPFSRASSKTCGRDTFSPVFSSAPSRREVPETVGSRTRGALLGCVTSASSAVGAGMNSSLWSSGSPWRE
jgi:hypothetical protein